MKSCSALLGFAFSVLLCWVFFPRVASECLQFPSLYFHWHLKSMVLCWMYSFNSELFNTHTRYIRTHTHTHKESSREHSKSKTPIFSCSMPHDAETQQVSDMHQVWKHFSLHARHCWGALIDRLGFSSPLWSGFSPGFMEAAEIYSGHFLCLVEQSTVVELYWWKSPSHILICHLLGSRNTL